MKTARKKVSAGTLFERFGIVLILILICLVLSILSPSFLSIKNFVNVFRYYRGRNGFCNCYWRY